MIDGQRHHGHKPRNTLKPTGKHPKPVFKPKRKSPSPPIHLPGFVGLTDEEMPEPPPEAATIPPWEDIPERFTLRSD